jgi:hypothetical protein
MGLVKQILEFYEAVDDWCKLPPDVSNRFVLGKAAWVLNTVCDLNSHLEERIEEIKNGVIRDPFYCNFWIKRCKYLNHRGGALEAFLAKHGDFPVSQLQSTLIIKGHTINYFNDFIWAIKEELETMNQQLDTIKELILKLDPAAYGNYFRNCMDKCEEMTVTTAYRIWAQNNQPLTIEKLKAKLTEAIAKALKAGIMSHDDPPARRELQQVDLEQMIQELPADYELPDDFKKRWAQFCRYTHWDGDILRFDYNKYGRYGCCHRDEFTEEERYAVYELDKTQQLVRQDMEKLLPEQAQKPSPSLAAAATSDQEEELFHFIHPSLDDDEGWKIHNEVKRLVRRMSIPDIIKYLRILESENIILMPTVSSVAYDELVRMGMPNTGGFSKEHFRKQYHL